MITETLKLYHELMKKGFLDRNENTIIWSYVEDSDIRDELDQMGRELGFDILPAQDRIYMVPTQDNDILLKNNVDYRADIKANSETKTRDLYLLNYLAVYVLYLFFKGEGNDAQVRDFILKEDLIKEFTEHCENVIRKGIDGEDKTGDFSENFYMLAQDWLSKKEGDQGSRRMEDRYGVVNKIVLKFRADELFVEEDNILKPTKKTRDLMPYVLRKDRTQLINKWLEEENYATD